MRPDDAPALALAPDATNLRPVYAISVARVSAVPWATGVQDAVAEALEEAVATIWLFP